MRRIKTLAILFLTCISIFAQSPKHEVRAMWLTTIGGIDWPRTYANNAANTEKQKQELCHLLDLYKASGINTILFQTRIRGTMLYPSRLEPWDGCVTGHPGTSPGYDVLQFAIDETHRRGMELHAWVVTIPMGKWTGKGCTELRKTHPELLKKIGQDGFLDPEHPGTARYLADVCGEIVSKYDVDGIHLDYIRYPETWKIKVSRDEGRRNITAIARTISQRVKSLKPWVKMSCSPIGKYKDLPRHSSHGWNAYTAVCQDAQSWLRDGIMDALFPMMYFKGDQFYPFAADWSQHSYGKMVAPGLGIYFLWATEANWPLRTITQEMEVCRQLGMGHTYFRGKFFTDNAKGIYDFAKNQFDKTPALIPPMTWQHATPPTPPTQMKVQGGTVTWSGAKDRSNAPYLLYNVYMSRSYPVDTDNPENLVAMRLTKNELHLSRNIEAYYIAVTAMDRYGNESKPLQSHQEQPQITLPDKTEFLPCDGRWVKMPASSKLTDSRMIVVESLQGIIVATKSLHGDRLNVQGLADGVYQIKSVDRKGNTHRLGYFMKKSK